VGFELVSGEENGTIFHSIQNIETHRSSSPRIHTESVWHKVTVEEPCSKICIAGVTAFNLFHTFCHQWSNTIWNLGSIPMHQLVNGVHILGECYCWPRQRPYIISRPQRKSWIIAYVNVSIMPHQEYQQWLEKNATTTLSLFGTSTRSINEVMHNYTGRHTENLEPSIDTIVPFIVNWIIYWAYNTFPDIWRHWVSNKLRTGSLVEPTATPTNKYAWCHGSRAPSLKASFAPWNWFILARWNDTNTTNCPNTAPVVNWVTHYWVQLVSKNWCFDLVLCITTRFDFRRRQWFDFTSFNITTLILHSVTFTF